MKEGVIDVLMYIFSSYIDSDNILPEDRDSIDADLREAGFNADEINKAFDWLDGLALAGDVPSVNQSNRATRIFTAREQLRMDIKIQGFLIFPLFLLLICEVGFVLLVIHLLVRAVHVWLLFLIMRSGVFLTAILVVPAQIVRLHRVELHTLII